MRLLLGLIALATASCGNRPPQIQPPDLVPPFVVGERGRLELRAYDPDGDVLSWDYDIPGLVDEKIRSELAGLIDKAIFTFTPVASDVGEHQLGVSVSDGTAQDTVSVPITVRPSGPGAGAPKFLRPLEAGNVFFIDQDPCLEIDVVVEDVDSLNVRIYQEPPIAGSTLEEQHKGPKTARFHWCPSEQQKLTTRHVLYLVADDGDNPPVRINDGAGYYIVLERD